MEWDIWRVIVLMKHNRNRVPCVQKLDMILGVVHYPEFVSIVVSQAISIVGVQNGVECLEGSYAELVLSVVIIGGNAMNGYITYHLIMPNVWYAVRMGISCVMT